MKKYTIQMAAEITGLSTHTIRAWEKRYQALVPERSSTGRRNFSENDLERLTLLAKLTRIGNPIGQIANLPDPELQALLQQLTNVQRSQTILSPENATDNIEKLLNQLLTSLESYDVTKISKLVELAKSSVNPHDFALNILAPLVESITALLSEKKLSMAKFATLRSIIKFYSGDLIYGGIDQNIKTKTKVVITTPENEHSPFEILLTSILCHHHKIHFYFLSTNMPATSTIDATSAVGAEILILGINHTLTPMLDLNLFLQEIIMSRVGDLKIWLIGSKKPNSLSPDVRENVHYFNNYLELDLALKKIK